MARSPSVLRKEKKPSIAVLPQTGPPGPCQRHAMVGQEPPEGLITAYSREYLAFTNAFYFHQGIGAFLVG